MAELINITPENLAEEHICCAISDKKCIEGYNEKKAWLRRELEGGYVFRRLDARAKVFIEYGPAETAWLPISAPGYLNINCFWVSGKHKKQGYGKLLLQSAWEDAQAQGKKGLVTVVGTRKFHFMSDTKWLLRQGFEEADRISSGFSLLVKKLTPDEQNPGFKDSVRSGTCPNPIGLTAYYSNRCPYAPFHAEQSLSETAEKRGLPLKLIKLETPEQAQSAPSPASIFSLFLDGQFVTTDLSACMDSRFDKVMDKWKERQ